MIICRSLEKRYPSLDGDHVVQWALPELSIEKGACVLITGPSGCGKTTLLNLLAGLIRPDAGTILVNEVRVDELSTAEADIFRGQHLGLVFQSFQLIAPLTVLDNILLGARYGRKWDSHEARERADQLLEQVGLRNRRNHRPSQLSIGEQQRVAIARALINEPLVLLADEPTASLDTSNPTKVMDLLFALCASHGTTLVAVSHDTSLIPRFTERIDATHVDADASKGDIPCLISNLPSPISAHACW